MRPGQRRFAVRRGASDTRRLAACGVSCQSGTAALGQGVKTAVVDGYNWLRDGSQTAHGPQTAPGAATVPFTAPLSFADRQRSGLLMLALIADAQALGTTLAGTDVLAAVAAWAA